MIKGRLEFGAAFVLLHLHFKLSACLVCERW